MTQRSCRQWHLRLPLVCKLNAARRELSLHESQHERLLAIVGIICKPHEGSGLQTFSFPLLSSSC